MSETKDNLMLFEGDYDYDSEKMVLALNMAAELKDHNNLSEEEFETEVSKMMSLLPSDLFGHLWEVQWDIGQQYGDVAPERFGELYRPIIGKAFGDESRYCTMLDVITEAAVFKKKKSADNKKGLDIAG